MNIPQARTLALYHDKIVKPYVYPCDQFDGSKWGVVLSGYEFVVPASSCAEVNAIIAKHGAEQK